VTHVGFRAPVKIASRIVSVIDLLIHARVNRGSVESVTVLSDDRALQAELLELSTPESVL